MTSSINSCFNSEMLWKIKNINLTIIVSYLLLLHYPAFILLINKSYLYELKALWTLSVSIRYRSLILALLKDTHLFLYVSSWNYKVKTNHRLLDVDCSLFFHELFYLQLWCLCKEGKRLNVFVKKISTSKACCDLLLVS